MRAATCRPGIHPATLAELVAHFGSGTPQRQRVAQRLEHIYAQAKASGHLARFVVFGSFVTAKPAPNDVDIFMLMEDDFDVSQVPHDIRIVFDHTAAQNFLGASVFWIRRAAALGGEEATIQHWQITRSGRQRGIVEVISHD
jgi:hypothetical protein